MGHDSPGVRPLLEALERSAPLIGLVDTNDDLIWANEAFDRTFLRGLPLPVNFFDMLRHGFQGGFGVHIDCGDVEQFIRHSGTRRRVQRHRAFAIDLQDGRWIWMTESLQADDSLLLVASDITALKAHEGVLVQAHRTALSASLTDELTGVANRRHILAMCRQAIEQESLAGKTWVVMLDLDHFKAINDTFGHDGGDKVLRHFADHCTSMLRSDDRFGRIGGEEFLLLLQGESAAVARQVVDRLRDGLSPASGIGYGFSAGIARSCAGMPLEDAMARADEALYRAKGQGRGMTVVSPVDE